jgi:hypothetical protein
VGDHDTLQILLLPTDISLVEYSAQRLSERTVLTGKDSTSFIMGSMVLWATGCQCHGKHVESSRKTQTLALLLLYSVGDEHKLLR